jgi:methylated-DNA-protein-cysteine methyltransferase-like protein
MRLETFLNVIRGIPRGRVMTYGEVARAAGHPGAARQVVWALKNCGPGVPWHRVVGAGNRIRLTGEAGLEQRLRLQTEGCVVRGSRVLSKQELDAELKPPRAPRRKNAAKAR